MSYERETPNQGFAVDFRSHIPTQEKLRENFNKLDKLLGPAPTAEDLGKVLVVDELEDGTYGLVLKPLSEI